MQKNTRIKEAQEFIQDMSVIADYLESIKNEHLRGGKYYKRAQTVLANYRTMKFHSLAFSTNITADQCKKEISRRGEDIFEYICKYDNIPDDGSVEYPSIATVYDVLDLCGDTFTSKHLEEYLSSKKVSFEAILSIFCEQVLLEIKKRNDTIFKILYTEYFDLSMEYTTAAEKWEHVNINRNSYYNYLRRGITLFSYYLFTPLGEMYEDENKNAHNELLKHLKEAAKIAIDLKNVNSSNS